MLTKSVSAIAEINRQVINVSAASVVTAHCHADNCRSVDCHSAQPRVARYKLSDAFFVVAFGNLQTFDLLPELKRRLVIVDGKFPSNDLATHKCLVMSSEVETSPEVT